MNTVIEILEHLEEKKAALKKEVEFYVSTTSRLQGNVKLISLNTSLDTITELIEFIVGEEEDVDKNN